MHGQHSRGWRSWDKPVSYEPVVYSTQTSHYSSILNKEVHGYGEMPKVEETRGRPICVFSGPMPIITDQVDR